MNFNDDGKEGFVMVHQQDLHAAMAAINSRKLELRDMAVFMGLMSEVNWRSGKARITAKALAEKLGIKLPVCVSSLKRLRTELLVSRVKDSRTGEMYFLLNPHIASVGGPQKRGHLWQQFKESLDCDEN